MYKLFSSLLFSSFLLNASEYSFINSSVNYLDWTRATQNKTTQKDFSYLELEGGTGWKWGEFYGFADFENPTSSYSNNPPNNLRFAIKPILDIYLASDFSIHIQDYYLKSDTFYVSNFLTGIAYKYTSDFGLWIKPFIGSHYQNSTYYSGFNGYMMGWTLNYDMHLVGEKFSIFQWHEIEFNRDKEHFQPTNTLNGAISIWWHINESFTAGLQYRYADNKLGFETYQSAMIYSLKYNL